MMNPVDLIVTPGPLCVTILEMAIEIVGVSEPEFDAEKLKGELAACTILPLVDSVKFKCNQSPPQ